MTKHYKEVKAKADFVEIEKEVLKFWDEDKTFEKSVHNRDGAAEFVFYDGPPFANGTPHYGHIMVSYVKDVVARYQTMNGKKVERRLGWDCHGLPAEMSAEKQLGVSGRKQIEEYGVEKFNDFCRSDVLKYSGIWVEMFKRIGRWVDFSHDYKTMDLPFMESVINNFKQLWEKGLVYEDYRVLPYSWAAETPLSNFEVNQGYQDKTDNAITVMFTLENGMKMLVWTTTPWTLPSNLMLAVGKDIDYAVMEEDGQKYVLAQALLGRYKKQLEHAARVGTMKGADFVGMAYEPMFPYFKHLKEKGAFRVLSGEFVSTEDGTGIVHIAPGFGQDDFEACRAYDENFPVVCPVDEAGRFTAEVPDYQGKQVFETNEPIMQLLKEKGILVKKEQYTHSYPFCWRTDTPLIYKAMSSWFVKVTDFRDDMVRNNQQITWVPEHIKDGRFGKWLEGARDWSISRNRFWGTPIPVWKSDNPQFPRIDVFGSVAEIKEKTGIEVTNLQRRILDTRKCKYMPTDEELNPNTRFVDNRFVAQLAENDTLKKYVDEQGLSWSNDEEFVKNVLDTILSSEIYAEYLKNEEDSYETDREFWRQIFKKVICGNEMIEEYLEDKSIYWNDDIEIVETFALKTIKKFEEKKGSKQALLPMFKDLEDKAFAIKLFRQSLLKGKEYRERIDKHMKNWETERIANMDLIIMQVALAEILSFPTIPINVTLNEYIDAAKYYSTPKSGTFINGILDSIVNELKKEKLLLKD